MDNAEHRLSWSVGVCSGGCVHLTFGCTVVHLSRETFLEIAARMSDVRAFLLQDENVERKEPAHVH
ncbi:MAG TPA: hypothetical protein VI895_03380 [Bdellovibrionota bacterium]|nr:hypothetical protein [Bdellovibrionota bacterium]